MEKSKYIVEDDAAFEILKLVTEIAVARVGNEAAARTMENEESIKDVEKLVRTLFSTMCEIMWRMHKAATQGDS